MRLIGMIFLLIALVCIGAAIQSFAVEPVVFALLFGMAGTFLTFHRQPLE